MPDTKHDGNGDRAVVKARIVQTASDDAHYRGILVTWETYGFKEGEVIDIEIHPVGSPMLEWYIGKVKARSNGWYVNIIHGEVELIKR